MGLYGSEYWTLPRRVGDLQALALTEECKPVYAKQAARIRLVDQLVEFSETDGLPELSSGSRWSKHCSLTSTGKIS